METRYFCLETFNVSVHSPSPISSSTVSSMSSHSSSSPASSALPAVSTFSVFSVPDFTAAEADRPTVEEAAVVVSRLL